MMTTVEEINWVKSLDIPRPLKQDLIDRLLDTNNDYQAFKLLSSLERLEHKGLISVEYCNMLIQGKDPLDIASIIIDLNDAEILTQETIQYVKTNPGDLSWESDAINSLVKEGCLNRASYIFLMEMGKVDGRWYAGNLLILLNKNNLLNAEVMKFLRKNSINFFSLERAASSLDEAGFLDNWSWHFIAGHPKQAFSKADILVSLLRESILDDESVINLLKEYYNCPEWRHDNFWHALNLGINKLHSEKLLNRQNFYFLLQHSQYALDVAETMVLLNKANILTDYNLDLLAKIPHEASSMCSMYFSKYSEDNTFTQETYSEVIQKYQQDVIRGQMETGVPALYNAIDEMKHYGERLHQEGEHCKSLRILSLSCRLKDKVDNFVYCIKKDRFTRHSSNYRTLLTDFKQDFSHVLHSEDEVLAIHRAAWKTIVANILIALTGIGTLALMGQMVYSKLATGQAHLFFHKTRSERDRDRIDALSNHLSVSTLREVAEATTLSWMKK